QEFFDAAPAIQYHMDEPLPNPSAVPLYFVAQEAGKQVMVVLSGEGADELFGGYRYYQECIDFQQYMKVPQPIRSALGGLAARLPQFHGRRFLMRGRHPLPVRYIRNNYVYAYEDCNKFLKNPLSSQPPEFYSRPVFDQVKGQDEITQMQYADMLLWMQFDILQKADKMSMANSLELRVPFLDRQVLELALQIPSQYRVTKEETKLALRRAAATALPEKTSNMPKIGFLTPLNDWLKQEPFYGRVHDAFQGEAAQRFFQVDAITRLLEDHKAGRAKNMKKIWSIYCFLLWYEEFFVKR
ncbi:MAG: asparagine synthase C-terminal domain-containing protein, partial [Oscillospiraceae bacterium]|nr:asparagine synthase C-terminal domain-containing protein [Oscillospiraceae bacterium]